MVTEAAALPPPQSPYFAPRQAARSTTQTPSEAWALGALGGGDAGGGLDAGPRARHSSALLAPRDGPRLAGGRAAVSSHDDLSENKRTPRPLGSALPDPSTALHKSNESPGAQGLSAAD